MPKGRRGHCVIAAPSGALASLDALITDHELPIQSCFEACSSSLFCIALEFSPANASSSALADCRLVKGPLSVEAVAPSDTAACYVRRKLLGVDRDAPLSPAHPAADKEDPSTGPDFGEPRAPLGASGQGSVAFHTLLAHSQQQAAARTERFSRAEAAKPAAADVIGDILARSRASGRHAAPSAG
ncbi:hypothetical protein EMIHUDRAFT_215798 [Emiliania huxleyi CCMP1516]|uniref:Apple domain-containing protein n=2 Tax=Emiliania huxleyi TaxID=2903 RepID=A0A0D3IGY9_EMIH1|nr:hypothetical protein EMIHUDRAFT_215798 [Emiliania huxleyi CCMP1516]EOD10524.1 hypothetical protein EMIHUDRAFT_215798 [Emiliania huxleyi CCMP1516]|eukprot:XP_005762953.1 hypothetical protein EMIHUDRAFT_215798 [Emiliania huxleyi CCMP1516]